MNEVETDLKRNFVSFNVTLSVFFHLQDIPPEKKLARVHFREGPENDMEKKNEGIGNKRNFDCTMDKLERDGT